jgi:hypothetical protein
LINLSITKGHRFWKISRCCLDRNWLTILINC